jgi:predicted nucleic acid-binding protein
MRDDAVLLDTGVLVALLDRNDAWHTRATHWIGAFHGHLHTVEAVLVETAFFLPARQCAQLAELAAGPSLTLHHPDSAGHARIAQLLRKYADQDPDWADAALIWLAESAGIDRIATVDQRDFGVYRIQGRRKFRLELI